MSNNDVMTQTQGAPRNNRQGRINSPNMFCKLGESKLVRTIWCTRRGISWTFILYILVISQQHPQVIIEAAERGGKRELEGKRESFKPSTPNDEKREKNPSSSYISFCFLGLSLFWCFGIAGALWNIFFYFLSFSFLRCRLGMRGERRRRGAAIC